MPHFDYVIGNPAFQLETTGNQKKFAPPVYDKFLDAAYKVADKVEMIHPARFLFLAGATSRSWNEKMLNDPHLKIMLYEQNSSTIFPGTDIKGGVCISYHDESKDFGTIGVYTAFPELNDILKKVKNREDFEPFSNIISNRGLYRFSQTIYDEHPEEMTQFTDSRISSSSFERLPELFTEEKPEDGHEYIQIFGLYKGSRQYRWFRRNYIKPVESLEHYKVLIPKANGSGALGECLTTPLVGVPLVGVPLVGNSETFLSIGNFQTEAEAQACLKYIKTKFARVMLGVLKITQDNPPDKWKYVPMQNFGAGADLAWALDVPALDQQLYAKYGLNGKEIEFIETHVREMS